MRKADFAELQGNRTAKEEVQMDLTEKEKSFYPSIDWNQAIPIFIRDSDVLTKNEGNGCVTFPDLGANLTYGGRGCWTLFAAIRGWSSGVLKGTCPHCGNPTWILGIRGGPTNPGFKWGIPRQWVTRNLEVLGEWFGVCPDCGPVVKTSPAGPIVFNEALEGFLVPLGHKPILIERQPYSYDFKLGSWREPDQDEVRMGVPSWREFISSTYPEFLLPEPEGVE